MENTLDTDYFTEKRYQALVAASIPLVFRRPNSAAFLPAPNSALFLEDFDNDGGQVARYIAGLTDQEYAQLHAWKQQGISREFAKTLFHTWDFLACRLCEHFAQMPRPRDS